MSEPTVINRQLIKMINLLDCRENKRKEAWNGTFLVVQWLRLCAAKAGGTGLIPGGGTKIPHERVKNRTEKKKKTQKVKYPGFLPFYADVTHAQVALVVKNPPAIARNLRGAGLVHGLGRCPGEGNGTPLQYSCLENPMDRGAGGLQSVGL